MEKGNKEAAPILCLADNIGEQAFWISINLLENKTDTDKDHINKMMKKIGEAHGVNEANI
ncbi:hypothetical protein [Paenibacillus sp. HW567]|uniref:hypothetical protein n=1 Tax=Paenibacillus sp. HW567 TaxID=1034769 RepID=UPI0003A0CBE3|nr:hypothetical protein [Paenibacillus sp. HW567]